NTENKNTENVGNLMKSGDNAEFVRVSAKTPDYLELSSGKPYLPIGVNLCILRAQNPDGTMRLLSDEEALQKMEFYFQRLSENGGNYARVWLGMPQFDIETERPGHFDAQKIENVHRLLDLASRYGIRLKFCLEHFRNLGDSPVWNDGKVTFSKRLYHGEVAQKMSDFTLSDAGRNAYLARTRKYIDLFGSHPAVFGWELWNEVNCIPNADVWTEFMLARVTEMNPNQLVFQSLGSFDSPAQFERYRTHTKMRQNTLLQVHRYLDPGAKLPICQAPMDVLAADCATTVRAWGVRKPILVTELGAVRACHAGPSELYEMDTEGVLFHDILFAPFFAGAAAPGHCWHWHVYLEQHDLWRHVGRFSEAVRGVNPVSEQFQPFYEEQNGLRIYGLRGEKTVLVWIRDAENDSQRELIEKKPVETRKDVKITISENYTPRTGTHRPTRLDIYHPWEDRHETVPLPASATIPPTSQLTLPPLTRSCVLRIEGGE
ncbi:MAG: hypothetical protein Q4C70_11960, partial [Planctomycetia bacterium]|nr:hypothetical protein [Planctomycetia bacterium]